MINWNLTNNQKMFLNLISSLIFFAATIGINFFLTPYIVNNIGVEANGFISLGNNFITYASLITIAVSSMSSRFITIELEQGNLEKANLYYTSVTIGNIIISSIIFLLSLIVVYYLEYIIDIPQNLILDIKLLFILLFLNFAFNSAFSSWKISTFATNKLYLESIRDMQAQILRLIVVILLFVMYDPLVFYVGIAGLVATIFNLIFTLYYKKMLLPDLIVSYKFFRWKVLWVLLTSGIWNTIITAGQLLLSGLDLLIANILLGPSGMGVLALSKTLPNVITQLAGKITHIFTPSLTISYAQNNTEEVLRELKKGMKITAILLTVPLGALIVYGYDFYQLWVPGEDAYLLQVLSILSAGGLIFTSGIQVIFKVFTVANKLKTYASLILISGVVTTGLIFLLLHSTNLGVYAIAGVSTIVNLIRNLFFTLPLASKYLKVKWSTFYPEVISSVTSVFILVVVGFLLKLILPQDTWAGLALSVILMSLLSIIANLQIQLSKNDRKFLYDIIRRKLTRIKGRVV